MTCKEDMNFKNICLYETHYLYPLVILMFTV